MKNMLAAISRWWWGRGERDTLSDHLADLQIRHDNLRCEADRMASMLRACDAEIDRYMPPDRAERLIRNIELSGGPVVAFRFPVMLESEMFDRYPPSDTKPFVRRSWTCSVYMDPNASEDERFVRNSVMRKMADFWSSDTQCRTGGM